MIAVLDESVGAMVKALEEHGLRENTLIIFCSDNGPALPAGFQDAPPFRGKKGSMLEGGHRVPAIMSWPNKIPAGKECHFPLMTMDFFPTFARLGGVSLPENYKIEGNDILPALQDEKGDLNRVLHWRFGDQWAVRKGDWKLIDGRVLYHLGNDPGESENLAKQHSEIVRELLSLNQDWTGEVGMR